jgi:K+-transporting ATPase ATPase A chain
MEGGFLKQVRPAITMFLILAIITGIGYPLAITAIGQAFFPAQANGSKIILDGNVTGSVLIGQPFSDPKYFWGRLSATPDFPYNANYSTASNLGPNDPRFLAEVQARVDALHEVDPNNTAPIPVDLVTSSGSGLDPDISIGAAVYQAQRVATYRNLTINLVNALIQQNIQPRQLFVFGEPRINVLELNLALDKYPNGTRNVTLPFDEQAWESEISAAPGMQPMDWVELALFFAVIAIIAVALGRYLYKKFLHGIPNFIEKSILQASNVDHTREMDWKTYIGSLLLFNGIGIAFLFTLCEIQGLLPLNPNGCPSLSPGLAFNVAVSFVTNTNWQSYAGEAQLSYLTQMLGLTVQNFLSAATGIAILLVLMRGLVRRSTSQLGNFWWDILRATGMLLVVSSIIAVFMISQGSPQTLGGPLNVNLLQPVRDAAGNLISHQTIQVGPVASQAAIKVLGSNGGGFFNANGAHPFENPTPLTDFVLCVMIIAFPASFCFTFGKMVHDDGEGSAKEGTAIFIAMLVLFVGFLVLTIWAELRGNPLLAPLNIDQSWGNMEGKEVRFGSMLSSLYATAATATSNGSVIAAMESFTPLGSLGPLLLMQLGEVAFGGVGCGLYGMLHFVLLAGFIAGLMVGRTPEYLGKKLGPREMKQVTIVILLPIVTILTGAAIAILVPAAVQAISSPGPHGFTELIYAFTSAVANNGSAFAGLSADIPFYNFALAIAMLVGRFAIAWFTLKLAGLLAERKRTPSSAGTLNTHSMLYIGWVIAVIIIVGVLSFIPVLILGPIAEAMI